MHAPAQGAVVFCSVALACVAAGCGGHHRALPPTHVRVHAKRQREPPARSFRGPALLELTVIDGDSNDRIAHARVRIGGRAAETDRTGFASIRVLQRRPTNVVARADGYEPRTVFESFRQSRKATIRLYRPELQWPMYGVTAARTQTQTHIELRPPFRTMWDVQLGGLIEFPAVVADGVAYIGNASAQVHAISMRLGTIEWTHDTPHGEMASSPAVAGGDLVYHTMTGDVVDLDRANGAVRWIYHVGSPIESSPLIVGGLDYFGAWDGTVYALNMRTRRLLWTQHVGAKVTSSASAADGSLFIGDYAGRLWSLSAATGAPRWERSVNGRIYGTPAIAARRIFVPSSDGNSMTAFSVNGRTLWSVHTGGYVYSSPAVWDGRVYFGSYDGALYAVSAATGRVDWRVSTGGPVSGAATVVDGVAYAGSFAHRIIGVDARTGRTIFTFAHGEYAPVSGDGMRLLLHGYSDLYAVQPTRAARH